MQLDQAFRITNTACLALTGSGGKTTTLFQLARSLSGTAGLPVIVSATTHLHIDQIKQADSHLTGDKPVDFSSSLGGQGGVILVTGPLDGDRTRGLDDTSG